MSDGYVIENGDIKLTLSDADLEDILEDVKDCRDLLEPQIRLIGNTLVFRDQDIAGGCNRLLAGFASLAWKPSDKSRCHNIVADDIR